MKRLNKNSKNLENKLDDENTYKMDKEIERKARSQMELIEARKKELEAELDELSYLYHEYDSIESDATAGANENKRRLEVMGYSLDANKRETEKAYYEFQELETYVGYQTVKQGIFGNYTVAELLLDPYRIVEGEYVKLSVVETCQYSKDFN
jgi:DNA repair exonuclease SbcCD ATPase subunit